MNDPINKSVTVPLSPDEAFTLFTKGIHTWWPGGSQTVLWGHILAYDPGKYLAFTWFPGKSEAEATVVTVTFSQTDAGTQCDLQHGGFDILGDLADAISTSYLSGWDMVLGCYCSAAKTPALV